MRLFRKRPREEGGLGDRLSVFAIRLLGKLPWKLALGIGGFLGTVLALVPFAKPRRIALINLALCLPECSPEERRRIARRSLVLMVKNVIAGAVSWVAPVAAMQAKISRVDGEELMHRAVAANRGVIFISPHMGCWEFLNFYLCSRHDLIILAKTFGGPALNDLISAGRSRLRGTLVPTTEKGVRALLGALKKGGMTYLTPDHVPKESAGIFAPFFGVSTTTGILTSRLIQKTGATVVAVTCTLNDDDSFSLQFTEVDGAVYSDDLPTSVAGLNRTIEKCVMRCPEQYQWAYRRFKSIEGRANPY